MKLTIIETGRPPEPIAADFPRYPVMLEALIRAQLPALSCNTVSLVENDALPDQNDLDAVLITGSPVGVYDRVAWIEPLKGWIRANARARIPQVGICFGHQIIAAAFGGHVAKAPQGWGLGRHDYELTDDHLSRPCGSTRFSLAVSHQDQVLTPPKSAQIVAHSSFTPYAALQYPDAPALTFQGHPEFCRHFAEALIKSRRGTRFSEDLADRALASLDGPLDGDFVSAWIANFYQENLARDQDAGQANAA
jgi:GMP synthase-like glutamine amidotransferase